MKGAEGDTGSPLLLAMVLWGNTKKGFLLGTGSHTAVMAQLRRKVQLSAKG